MLGSVSPYAAKSRLYVASSSALRVGGSVQHFSPAPCWWVQGGADGLLKFSCDCPAISIKNAYALVTHRTELTL